MSYIAPVHRPTSIRHAVRIRFLSPDIEDLVVAKANRLEIWRLDDQGMTCLHTKLIYGTISMLQRLQPKDSDRDLLFIATDRLQYFNVAWNTVTNQLETVEQSIQDAAEQHMRHSQTQNWCLVDPTGKYMAMHLWEGVLNVFRLPTRKGVTTRLTPLDQVRLTELWMKASTFLHSRTGHPRIAFLYKTQLDREEARIAVYRLTKDDQGNAVAKFDPVKERELDQKILDPYASMLIPIPPVKEEKRYHVRNTEGAKPQMGGLLVVGETLLTYFDSLTYASVQSVLQDPTIYVAWAEYDSFRYFLADDYGRLFILKIETSVESSGDVVSGMNVTPIKHPNSDLTLYTSRAASLVYMGGDKLFLASHHGDSQLFHVNMYQQTVVLVKTLSSNAPILDFAIMDMGNREGDSQLGNPFSSGQARIVAGCGAYRDGSLRSIRSGVGLEEKGILTEMENTSGLFTLTSSGASHTDTLLVSSATETRVFRFDAGGGIEEPFEFAGMSLGQQTLFAGNVSHLQLLQVTQTSAMLFDAQSGMTLCSWDAPDAKVITDVSVNSKWALLSIEGTTLVSLDLENSLAAKLQESPPESASGQLTQISCLHAARNMPNIGIVGWWASGTITIIDLETLKPVLSETLRQNEDSASVPLDVALVQLHPPETSGPTLVVALEDGDIVTFNMLAAEYTISGRRRMTLGNKAAHLHVLPKGDGTYNVLAINEHASLIYGADERIIYSATTAEDATHVAPFNSQAFPECLFIATKDYVRLCRIDKERLTHVRTLKIGETVRRVAYSPASKAFGLGCIKKELVVDANGGEEVISSTFRLVDEIGFEELGIPYMLNAPTSLEMVEAVIRAKLPDSTGNLAERFIVGTSFVTEGDGVDEQGTKGRILVLGVDKDRQIYQIVSHKLKGACRCLGMLEQHIVAGLSKTVVIYDYIEKTTASGSLEKLATFHPASVPVGLDIFGNTIGVIDLMQSLSLVEFVPAQEGNRARLEEKARHHQAVWTTSICHLDGNRWLEADAQGNLMVLQRNPEAPTQQDRNRLEVTGEFNIGEQINRIRKLHVPVIDKAIVLPKAFMASIEGSLFLYGEIAPSYQDLLLTFQTRLQDYVYAPGNISFDLWRAFRNQSRDADAPFRFVDGEMIERFLDLDEGKQELVCEGLGPTVEDMRRIIEDLRRLH